mmetsp:Transcript_55317/g.154071  ORF Transcript_55317/g.154071 Transcript_55317/m.154071 type:complete len:228 (+) Transcript_55317:160-843(+)
MPGWSSRRIPFRSRIMAEAEARLRPTGRPRSVCRRRGRAPGAAVTTCAWMVAAEGRASSSKATAGRFQISQRWDRRSIASHSSSWTQTSSRGRTSNFKTCRACSLPNLPAAGSALLLRSIPLTAREATCTSSVTARRFPAPRLAGKPRQARRHRRAVLRQPGVAMARRRRARKPQGRRTLRGRRARPRWFRFRRGRTPSTDTWRYWLPLTTTPMLRWEAASDCRRPP